MAPVWKSSTAVCSRASPLSRGSRLDLRCSDLVASTLAELSPWPESVSWLRTFVTEGNTKSQFKVWINEKERNSHLHPKFCLVVSEPTVLTGVQTSITTTIPTRLFFLCWGFQLHISCLSAGLELRGLLGHAGPYLAFHSCAGHGHLGSPLFLSLFLLFSFALGTML